VRQFEAGDLSAVVEMARVELPADAPSARWSFSNRVMAYAQSGSVDCRGYRQWQAADRQVRRGASASYILGPVLVKRAEKDKEGEDVERERLVGFRAIPVFGYGDTDGEGEGALEYAPRALPPLLDVAERLGVDVSYAPVRPGALGNCTPDGARVVLGSHDASVFFHELGHAAHAKLEGGLKGGQDADQEVVAEFVAAVLMHLYGLGDRTGNCWRYVSAYAPEPLAAINRALGTVERVLALICSEEQVA
jgi:antirestriction protein ArdC